jgi:hypothetical protein
MGSPGDVYILHNCALREGLLKIGLTARTAGIRAAELRTTGVPEKFLVLFSQRVSDAPEVERRLHARFDEYRYSDDREFFFVSPSRAITALIEEAEAVGKESRSAGESANVLPALIEMYGSLLDPSLKSVTIEVGDGVPASVVSSTSRDGHEAVFRRDIDFLSGKDGPYFPSTGEAAAVARLLLALGPYSLVTATPLFSRQGAQLIADMHERAELDARTLRSILIQAIGMRQRSTLHAIEAQIRCELDLPSHNLNIVSVNEYEGRFLLSLNRDSEPAQDLHISAEHDYDYQDSYSCAIVTKETIEELDLHDAIDIGYRYSPKTWTSDGPYIQVMGKTSAGIPFEQSFWFLP